MNMRSIAEEYRKFGFRPIPFKKGEKRPIVEWREFQHREPTDAEFDAWWGDGQETNMGAVVGPGLLVVDLDGGKSAEALLAAVGVQLPEDAPRSRTGSGYHVFLSVDRPVADRIALLSTNGTKPQVDIRGAGCVVLPPSIHPSGAAYQWVVPLEGKPPPAPPELLALLANGSKNAQEGGKSAPQGPGWVEKALGGVGEGQRDVLCAKLAGYFLGKKIDPATTEEILATTFGPRCSPPFTREDIHKTVESISRRQGVVGADREIVPEHISRVGKRLIESLTTTPPKVYATGFKDLDWYLCGGLAQGELAYLGARPGVGKTAFALQIAHNVARAGSKVLIVSREMANLALMRRMVAQSGRIDAAAMRRRCLSDDQLNDIRDVVKALDSLPIWLTDQATTIGEIVSMVETSQARSEGCLVIVDHLQLVRVPDAGHEKRAQVEAASQGLKTLALQYQIPVLCMSTLSRPFDKKNPKPTVDSLRESGELEHDADIIFLLHRKFKEKESTCEIAKNRDGHVGPAELLFEDRFLRFSTIAEDQPPDQGSNGDPWDDKKKNKETRK